MVIRVACLGAGYFSRFHHDAWRRIERAQLVAVADLDMAKAQAVEAPAFASLDEMLARTKPDLLDIITPPVTHFLAIKTAISAGVKAIICQKPFCQDLEQAKHAVALARSAGTLLIVHENFRFQPWYRAMHRLIANGSLGDIHNMTFRLRTGDGQGPRAYLDRQPYFQNMSRFLVHETAVHWIDTFRYLLGDVTAVYADLRRRNPAIKGEDAGIILMDHASGAQSCFDGNRHLDHAAQNHRLTLGEATLEGTKSTITLSGEGGLYLRNFNSLEAEPILKPQTWCGFGGDCVHALQSHVIAALLDGAPIENQASDYLRVLEIEQAIYRSAAETSKQSL